MSRTNLWPPEAPAMRDEFVRQSASGIVDRHHANGEGLIAILEEIQNAHGYLPEAALRLVAERTGSPLVDVFGVATFYRAFSLAPRGRHLIAACLGTACHVNRSPMVVEEFQRQLGIRAGQTTADGEFTLETVNCLGACALGPVVFVDGRCHPRVDVAAVGRILRQVRQASADSQQVAAK